MKKELEELERRINRLKEIEKQLDNLDVAGFVQEIASIRSKLKKPQSIKEVEAELKELEKKIRQHQVNKKHEEDALSAVKDNDEARTKKEMEELENRIARLKELEFRLDSLNVDGFEIAANSIRIKLRDPKAVKIVEAEMLALEDKIRKSDIWHTEGAATLEAAVKKSREGVALFNSKEYLKALQLFSVAVADLESCRSHAEHDKHILSSIDENILSCQRNMIACNLAEGSARSVRGKTSLDGGKWQQADEELEGAIDYYKKAGTIAERIKEDKKKIHADKLISSANNLIEQVKIGKGSEEIDEAIKDVNKYLAEAVKDSDPKSSAASAGKLLKAEELINNALAVSKKRNLAQHERTLRELMISVEQIRKSTDELKAREIKFSNLRTRFNGLNIEGLEEDAAKLKLKLEGTSDIDQLEKELSVFESIIKQNKLWKSTGSGIFESALETCKKATQAFYAKEYDRALALFSDGIDKFNKTKDYAGYDNHLMISISENINAARKNMLSSNLGLGAQKAEGAQDRAGEENYQKAIVEFESALAYFTVAKQLSDELQDAGKATSAEKLINITKNNIDDCQEALDRYRVSQTIESINRLIEESQVFEIRKEHKAARQQLAEADRLCREILELCVQRDFQDEAASLKEMMNDIQFKISGIGREPLPKIEEVQIDIAIDDSE